MLQPATEIFLMTYPAVKAFKIFPQQESVTVFLHPTHLSKNTYEEIDQALKADVWPQSWEYIVEDRSAGVVWRYPDESGGLHSPSLEV
jgi:hypothetical protein